MKLAIRMKLAIDIDEIRDTDEIDDKDTNDIVVKRENLVWYNVVSIS